MADRVRAASRGEVAQRAGVAPSTVSLVLNGQGDRLRVAKRTQQRIVEAARELRYVPDSAARAMAGGRHLALGIIVQQPPLTLRVPVFEDFAAAAIAEAARHQHMIKFLPPVVEDDVYDVFAVLRDAQVDGILVHSLAWLAKSLVDWKIPVVYVGLPEEADELPLSGLGAVTADECGGLRAAARHLLDLGHSRVAVVAGPPPSRVPTPRLEAFAAEFDGAAGSSAAVKFVQAADWQTEGGYQAMKRLLAGGLSVSAVHAGNDWMAVGVMRAAHEAGLRVPGDIDLIGFGDFQVSPYLTPPLTTVRWPLQELGALATKQLLAQLNGMPNGFGKIAIPMDLVIRGSSSGAATADVR